MDPQILGKRQTVDFREGHPRGGKLVHGAFKTAGCLESRIICVTAQNQTESWLNFEAGALAKAVSSDALVCPYLVDVSVTDVVGPLKQFESKTADDVGTYDLLHALNAALPSDLQTPDLKEVFEK